MTRTALSKYMLKTDFNGFPGVQRQQLQAFQQRVADMVVLSEQEQSADLITIVNIEDEVTQLRPDLMQSFLSVNYATACKLRVPAQSDVAIQIGSWVIVEQAGAGQLEVVEGSADVTVGKPNSLLSLFTAEQYSRFAMVKLAANRWSLLGDMELL